LTSGFFIWYDFVNLSFRGNMFHRAIIVNGIIIGIIINKADFCCTE